MIEKFIALAIMFIVGAVAGLACYCLVLVVVSAIVLTWQLIEDIFNFFITD